MARPWVMLGRIPRCVGARAAGAEGVEAAAQAEGFEIEDDARAARKATTDEEVELETGAELAADIYFPLVPTPRVTVMNAAPTAQADPDNPDKYPYILGVHSAALLLNFGVEPFHGVYFGELPYQRNLVVVRDFAIAGVEEGHPPTATARAERIVPRDGEFAVVSNIESIGFLSTPNGVHAYTVVELVIQQGSGIAQLFYIDADDDKWHQEDADSPLPNPDRQWIPSGVIAHVGMLWWFDLSWGLVSYNHFAVEKPLLRFHPLPEGRALDMLQPDIHDRRCITESQDELLFVEIIHDPDGGAEAAMVYIWTRISGGDNDDVTVGWDVKHAVSFQEIWNHDTYISTGLSRKVPVLAAVSPSKWHVVYFVLEEEERLFGVDLLTTTAFEYLDEKYDVVTPWPVPPSCRYVVPWFLPPHIAQEMAINDCAWFPSAQLSGNIQDVWNDGVEKAFQEIRTILKKQQGDEVYFVAFDTEFAIPDNIVPSRGEPSIPNGHYEQLRTYVNGGDLVQIGMGFADGLCNLVGGTMFQFNLQFNPDRRLPNHKGVQLMYKAGLKLQDHPTRGIPIAKFVSLLSQSGVLKNTRLWWVSFNGYTDFGFLLKLVTGKSLPESRDLFMEDFCTIFPRSYDCKVFSTYSRCIQGYVPPSLKGIASKLGVNREGEGHQAASDALLTLRCYWELLKMRPAFASRICGLLYGVCVCVHLYGVKS